jgi:hypothetical protein
MGSRTSTWPARNAEELLTAPMLKPTPLTEHVPTPKAAGAQPPIKSAANELDASRPSLRFCLDMAPRTARGKLQTAFVARLQFS